MNSNDRIFFFSLSCKMLWKWQNNFEYLVVFIEMLWIFTDMCPSTALLNICQDAAARRPRDTIRLSCVFSGVKRSDIIGYRWLDVDANEILYHFWVNFKFFHQCLWLQQINY